jgi:hypothetical protein
MKKLIITLCVLFFLGGIVGIYAYNPQVQSRSNISTFSITLGNINPGILYADTLPGDTVGKISPPKPPVR